MIGTTLSHFKITAKLGEGGMGEVWAAEDIDLHRPVALKVLAKETLEREDMRARFLREARTAAALNHPNICTIYEVGEVDQVPFIAMELVEGTGLDSCLGGAEPLALKEVVRLAVLVAEGMAAAHAQGIVHRDLKPGNVMLTPDGQVKILDFGLAKPQGAFVEGAAGGTLAETITAEMTKQGTILGTVSYMSPEQAEGKVVDSRSDVFSFGVLLYQMATGQLPFRGDTSTATLAKILEAEPEPPSVARQGLPADLERIIRRCLAKRPVDRYNDTRDLVADLRNLQTTGESQAVSAIGRETSQRSPWIWAAALLAAAVALFFITKPWFGGGEDPAPAAAVEVARPSVAVLPFHNLSADAENDYFSAGMTEEIISKLSRIDGLEVASRSSVASFTDRARDVQQIGSELGVRYLLDGSVRRAGDQVRVSAQLVDGETGRNLWSEDFNGSLEDVFAMQEQTALTIAERLNLELSPEEQRDVQKRATENVAAYDAYLRGMALSREWGVRARLEQAIEQFETALEHDPDYAAALAGIAFVESDMYRNFDTSEERIQRAEGYAQRAVELDPTMPDASHALGLIAGNRFDYNRAAQLLQDTVRLAPKESRYWDNLSWALAYKTPPDGQGSVDAAWEAIKLQPHFPGAYYHLGRGLIAMGRYEEARQAFETMIEQDPDFGARNIGMAQYYLAIGDLEEAMEWIERDAARDTVMVSYYRAAILAASGEIDEALATLEYVLEKGFRDFVTLEASPHFASLREEPRYQELISRYQE
ncbi:MAG: tetratricopeptide repeat protein [Acidobacteria bacterium]|nr:MAG: tetratricopeptide repeat protein [Acidobacteriota bacterium]